MQIRWLVDLHPSSLTWNLYISPRKRRFLLEIIIFRFHVKLQGSNWFIELCLLANKMNLTRKKQAAVSAAAFWRNGTSFRVFFCLQPHIHWPKIMISHVFFLNLFRSLVWKKSPFFVSKCQLVFGRNCFFFSWDDFSSRFFSALKNMGWDLKKRGCWVVVGCLITGWTTIHLQRVYFKSQYSIHHRMQVSFLFGSLVLREGP